MMLNPGWKNIIKQQPNLEIKKGNYVDSIIACLKSLKRKEQHCYISQPFVQYATH